jgi:alkylation response protein AidB-like acyl-CoA dehydrogenase
MITQFTKSQKAIVKAAKEFAKGEFDRDRIQELDRAGQFPRDIWEKAADLGFLGIHLPETFGGGAMGMMEHLLATETFCAHDSTMGSAIMLSGIGTEWLARYGGDALKEKYLVGILEGRMLPGAAMPKPGSRVTVSEPSRKTLCVNGEVDGVVNGGAADVYLIPADGGFVTVDGDQDGVTVEQSYQPLGLRLTASAKIRFADVEIPPDNLVSVKKGAVSPLLPDLRLLISALALGTARGAIDRSLAHVKKREQFGRKLANFQVLRHKLAKMETRLLEARCLVFSAAGGFLPKKPDIKLIAAACLSAVSAAVDITSEAIQLLGGYGYTVEYEVERYCRDAKTLQLLSGGCMALYDEIADAVI